MIQSREIISYFWNAVKSNYAFIFKIPLYSLSQKISSNFVPPTVWILLFLMKDGCGDWGLILDILTVSWIVS